MKSQKSIKKNWYHTFLFSVLYINFEIPAVSFLFISLQAIDVKKYALKVFISNVGHKKSDFENKPK